MNPNQIPSLLVAVTVSVTFLFPGSRASGAVATQNISFEAGWSAVWLEVEPIYPATHGSRPGEIKMPGDVFTDPKITKVITPNPSAGTAEFFSQNPEALPQAFARELWQQWNRSSPTATDNLRMVAGNQPYLIHASAPGAIAVRGRVRFHRPEWIADRYNLIGFGLAGTPSSPALPTFAEFFEPVSSTHQTSRIYRLNPDGNWGLVSANNPMSSNEAYWIYSNGPSQYMGPVSVEFRGHPVGRLNFGGASDAERVGTGVDALDLDLEEIVFTNLSSTQPAAPTLDLIEADPSTGSLSLRVVKPNSRNLQYSLGNRVDAAPGPTASPSNLDEIIPGLSTRVLTLGAQRNWTTGNLGRTNVYRLQTGGKSLFWLPVTATQSDILPPSTPLSDSEKDRVRGLWVGEVSVTGVSSLVEDGAPVRPAAAPAPIRILLHSDESGIVRLLSRVTIMKTRSADPSIPSSPVLVVDDKLLPYFEGIEERSGKKVGIRLEAVAFEMPRDTSVASQQNVNQQDGINDDLIDFIVAESTSPSTRWLDGKDQYADRSQVTREAIDSYLLFRNLRPPTLKETYHSTVRINGGLGAGKSLASTPGSLSLDAFHRANPFRHAFHQNHAKGPLINRELRISFDPQQSVPDRLEGSYREDITGLTKSRVTLTGRIKIQRVSPVSTLEGAQ